MISVKKFKTLLSLAQTEGPYFKRTSRSGLVIASAVVSGFLVNPLSVKPPFCSHNCNKANTTVAVSFRMRGNKRKQSKTANEPRQIED
jgi:hypothetical protein